MCLIPGWMFRRPQLSSMGDALQNITIGRYAHESVTREWAGWIEGIRVDGSTWILYLDEHGSPCMYWAQRERDCGAVVGEPVALM